MSITYFREDVIQKFKSQEVRQDLRVRIESVVQKIDPNATVYEESMLPYQEELIQNLANTNLALTCGSKYESQLLYLKLQFIGMMTGMIKEAIARRQKSMQLDYEDKQYQISPFGAKKTEVPVCQNKKFLMPVAARDPQWDLQAVNAKKDESYYHVV